MIPAVATESALATTTQAYLHHLHIHGFAGDIESNYASRLTVATDNSIYQQLPQAVVFPTSLDDVLLLTNTAQLERFKSITFGPRGGGTGTNGQSLTPGIVIDLSRHMRHILEINLEERWVRVEAGVVKDQLNAALRPHGFFFAPDLSTSNRATIGGMINTDASGQGSLVYGKTSQHLLSLTSVLVDGTLLHSEPCSIAEAEQLAQGQGVIARLYQQVLTTCIKHRSEILKKFPRLNRFLTGYDLEHVVNHDVTQLDLSRLIAGSEGTLAIVTEAKLNITPLAPHKALINIKYDSFESALRNSPFLVAAQATSVETIDSKILDLAKKDIIWYSVSDHIQPVANKLIDGLNIVEFNAQNLESLESQVAQLAAGLDQLITDEQAGVLGYQITYDQQVINKIYTMRKKAVGLLGNSEGDKKPQAFAEDTAVPPESLADFIMEFREILDGHQLEYGMFGHVDAGVLHVRPALDLCCPSQQQLLRQISDQVVALTAKYGGLMWGEHGRGYRSEYGPQFFGKLLFTELRKIKTVFDPDNRLNPGKICTPLASNAPLVSVDAVKRGNYDGQIPIKVKQSLITAMNCNGNGLCFNYDTDSAMCPSYKSSMDRRWSPKGRAGLMREWMRLVSLTGTDLVKEQQRLMQGQTTNWLIKLGNTLQTRGLIKTKPLFGHASQAGSELSSQHSFQSDFSHQVFEAMNSCLACKACANQCPIKVDVPEFRSQFLHFYYDRYLRPVKDYFVGTIERLVPWLAKAPRLINWFIQRSIMQWSIQKYIGYVDTPLLSTPTLLQRLKIHYPQPYLYDYQQLNQLSPEQKAKMVIIVQDAFTSFYEAQVVEELFNFIRKLGLQPILLPYMPNGKPQHVKGFLKEFAKTASQTASLLNQVATLNIRMIGMDSPMLLCFRHEYRQILGDDRGNFEVLSIAEWLSTINLEHIQPVQLETKNETFYLFSHCTEKTSLPQLPQQWVNIFQRFGLSLEIVATGCCGMAGTYGHEQEHLASSKQIYGLSWKHKVQQYPMEQILVTGFSCRSQVSRLEGIKPKHPIQVLLHCC